MTGTAGPVPSRLARALAEPGRTVITAELPAVDGGDLDTVRRLAEPLAPWVDGINATDNTAAHAHASNVAIAIALKQLGVEPILQVVCRDKNRLAAQADIAGAALHGVTNICCLTGDDVTAGDEPEARRVFDLDGPQLVRVAAGLAHGRYLSGRAIDPAPPLLIGAVENPGAPPHPYRVRRALAKAAAGACFLQLQIGYQPEYLEAFTALAARTGLTGPGRRSPGTALLQTICLVRNARALRFMDANVPGVSVPAAVIDRVDGAADPSAAAYDLALEQARHALAQPGVRGLHLIDFRRDGSIARLVTDLALAARAEPDAAPVA